MPQLTIRRIDDRDSIEELTGLLHRSFARLGAMGLNYTAVDQSVDETRRRVARGECYVAELGSQLAGTVVVEHPWQESPCEWFTNPSLGSAHQLAVDPALQGQGIGSRLMDFAEHWAAEKGYQGICIDTAEPATHLVQYYLARGYLHVGYVQWDGKRYRSVVMRKIIRPSEPSVQS